MLPHFVGDEPEKMITRHKAGFLLSKKSPQDQCAAGFGPCDAAVLRVRWVTRFNLKGWRAEIVRPANPTTPSSDYQPTTVI